jgi:hypothetical protein
MQMAVTMRDDVIGPPDENANRLFDDLSLRASRALRSLRRRVG